MESPEDSAGRVPPAPRTDEHGGAHFIVASSVKVLVSQIGTLALSIGFTIYLARVLTKDAFATFVVFGILSGMSKMATTLGLDSTVVQKVPGDIRAGQLAHACAYMKTAFLSRLVMVTALAAALAVFATQVAEVFLKDAGYASLVRCMIPALCLLAVVDGLQMQAQAVRQFGMRSWSDVSMSILTLVGSMGAYFLWGLPGYYLGASLGPLSAMIILLLSQRRYLFMRGVRPAAWPAMVRYSIPFYAKGFLRYSMIEADRVVVAFLMPAAALANYGIARKFTDYLRVYGSSVTTPALVKLGELRRSGRESLERGFVLVSRYGILIIAPVCILTAVFSPLLTEAFGGAKYRDAWPILAVLAIAQLIYFMAQVYGVSVVFIMARPIIVFLQDGLPGIVNLAVSLFLVSRLGASGMAWSQIVSYGLSLALAMYFARAFVSVRPDWHAWKVVAASTLPCVFAVPIALMSSGSWLLPLLAGVVALAVGVFFGAVAMTSGDWHTINSVMPRSTTGLMGRVEGGASSMRRRVVALGRGT